MTLRLMLRGAAAVALLAGPAVAQVPAPGAIGACDIAGMTPETHAALDTDADGELTLDEFRACPGTAGLPLDPAQASAFDAAFADADGDANGLLSLTEIAQVDETDTAEVTPPSSVAPAKGTVTVTQPAPQVEVTEPAPRVDVTQPAPAVTVEAPPPTVAVDTAAPTVAVTPAAPTVAVTPAAPSVAVTPAASNVAVTPAAPSVAVQTAEPTAAVAPSVDVAQQEPGAATPPAANVVPAPAAATAEGHPEPAVAAPAPAVAPPAANVAAAPAADPAPADPTAGGTVSAPMPVNFQINVAALDGKDVMNTAGDEIGKVADVLLDPRTDKPVVIISVGGILGIGDREIPFPYSDFTITGEEVVLNSALTSDQIEDMPEYEEGSYEPLPDTMRVP